MAEKYDVFLRFTLQTIQQSLIVPDIVFLIRNFDGCETLCRAAFDNQQLDLPECFSGPSGKRPLITVSRV